MVRLLSSLTSSSERVGEEGVLEEGNDEPEIKKGRTEVKPPEEEDEEEDEEELTDEELTDEELKKILNEKASPSGQWLLFQPPPL